jgi:hypothetical protein
MEERIDFNHPVETVIAWIQANGNGVETMGVVSVKPRPSSAARRIASLFKYLWVNDLRRSFHRSS